MKRLSMKALEDIARPLMRQALEEFEIPEELRSQVVRGFGYEGDEAIFELYIPRERPAEAMVIARLTLNAHTGTPGTVFIEHLKRRSSPA